MLWAYFDESGEHDRVTGHLKTLTLGGCVADAAAWDALSVSWHAALNNAGVEMFHMTDFEADAGEFRGWKSNHPEKRKWLLNSLLDQIITHVPTIIGFSESHEENGLEFKTTYRKGIVDSMVHFSWESLTEAAPFALVYAKHPQYSSNLIEKHFEAVGQHEAGLRTFAVQEPMGISPLRAADIVAYELSRHERNDRPERYPFTRLKQGVRSMKLI